MEHADLLNALGGPYKVSQILGIHYATPFKWVTRGIPANFWHKLVREACNRGIAVTIDDLEKTAPQKRHQKARAEHEGQAA